MLQRLVPNLRDLGELETTDGRMLASRRLLRSSALVQKPPSVAQAIFGYLSCAEYVDLRTEAEVDRDGIPDFPASWTWHHRPIHDIDLGRPIAAHNRAEALQRYADVVSYIAEQARDAPVVVACSLGKDRTGFVVALLLQWLGVRRDLIMRDFRLSNVCLVNDRRRLPEYWHDRRNAITRADEVGCMALLDLAARTSATPPAVVALAQALLLRAGSSRSNVRLHHPSAAPGRPRGRAGSDRVLRPRVPARSRSP